MPQATGDVGPAGLVVPEAMQIAVVLPTHNRPALLRQAVASLQAQTWERWSLVIVDDGSVPAVDCQLDATDRPVTWLRNVDAQGPSFSRNRGIQAAVGEVITFLDDDDLLDPTALEAIAAHFARHPQTECLFVNVDAFGPGSEGLLRNQQHAMASVLSRLGIATLGEGSLLLGQGLFEALLGGVPLAFQRVAVRREVLDRVGPQLLGPFGDLEWGLRFALRCRCALLTAPLYRVRCEGQSLFSRGDAQLRLASALVRINGELAALPEVQGHPARRARVRRELAKSRFDKAYLTYMSGQAFAWSDYLRSAAGHFGWRHFSLLARVLTLRRNCARVRT
jgi:glycosyltransferase involved in cell wall biosynthesis